MSEKYETKSSSKWLPFTIDFKLTRNLSHQLAPPAILFFLYWQVLAGPWCWKRLLCKPPKTWIFLSYLDISLRKVHSLREWADRPHTALHSGLTALHLEDSDGSFPFLCFHMDFRFVCGLWITFLTEMQNWLGFHCATITITMHFKHMIQPDSNISVTT